MKLIPQPRELHVMEGYFRINSDTKIALVDEEKRASLFEAKELQKKMQLLLGVPVSITSLLTTEESNTIYLRLSNLEEEAYQLLITKERVEIIGGSSKAVAYGVQTLVQIIVNKKVKLPALTIFDKPHFKNRGFYHDITRGEVPTLDTLKEIVDLCAMYKMNQLQLYIEHSFAFKEFTEIWSDVDPITAEEILILDEYCRERHIELVPSMSTFGHLYRILQSKSYSHLCELGDVTDKAYSFIDRQLHHTLDVTNKESIAFVESMLKQYIPLFTSAQFNICADETFDLGKGKSKDLVAEHGVGKVYVDFVNQVVDIVKGHGKTVMMWGDILAKHPEFISELPEDVILLHWDYSRKPQEDRVKLFHNSGRPYYMCSGVWGWNHLAPALRLAHSNILHMVQYGVQYGAIGILNTNWGDFGHINFLSGSIPGLIHGAAYSWNPEADLTLEALNEKISRTHYQDDQGQLLERLTELSDAQLLTFGSLVRYLERGDALDQTITNERIIETNERIEEIKLFLFEKLNQVPREQRLDLEEMIASADGIILSNLLIPIFFKFKENVERDLIVEPSELAVKFEQWFVTYSRLWRLRNRESELHRLKDFFMSLCQTLRSY